MPRAALRRLALLFMVATTASCGSDTTSPPVSDPPGPGDPPGTPAPSDPPNATANDGLWTVGGIEPAILRLAAPQLLANDLISAATTVTTTTATLFTLNAVAFDAAGTMWIASRDDSLVLAFTQPTLATSGSHEASTVIAPRSRSLEGPAALAFDRRHRLWVANMDGETIVRFDSAQLASSGAPMPAKVVRVDGKPTALAFDAAGALWVARITENSIARYSATQFDASESPVPDVVLTANGTSLVNPAGLAFDAAGNLWVTNIGNRTVVSFSPADLAATGSPAPRITLAAKDKSLGLPTGLAFDSTGNLWVANGDGVLDKFNSETLRTSGAPVPNVTVQLRGVPLLWNIAFWPKPRGLPLN
jgi:sugar lactone lactonase YvrE